MSFDNISHIQFLSDIFLKKDNFIAVEFVVNNPKSIDYVYFFKTMKMNAHVKGLLNSEWIYEVIVSPKIPTKNYRDFWI